MSKETEVELFELGTLDEEELNAEIRDAWRQLLSDPLTRAQTAKELGLDPKEIDVTRPPVGASITRSGIAGGEVLIHIADFVGGALATGMLDDARHALFNAVRKLWKEKMKRKVSPPGRKKLGKSKNGKA